MLGIALSDNVLVLLVFWELTSLTSFLLIGYWRHLPEGRQGARMALVVTGAGGLSLIAGMLLLGQAAGTYQLSEILTRGDRGAGLAALPADPAPGAGRRLHQVGAVPVPFLAAARHGGTHAGLGLPDCRMITAGRLHDKRINQPHPGKESVLQTLQNTSVFADEINRIHRLEIFLTRAVAADCRRAAMPHASLRHIHYAISEPSGAQTEITILVTISIETLVEIIQLFEYLASSHEAEAGKIIDIFYPVVLTMIGFPPATLRADILRVSNPAACALHSCCTVVHVGLRPDNADARVRFCYRKQSIDQPRVNTRIIVERQNVLRAPMNRLDKTAVAAARDAEILRIGDAVHQGKHCAEVIERTIRRSVINKNYVRVAIATLQHAADTSFGKGPAVVI